MNEREYNAQYGRNRYRKFKQRCLVYLGNACVICGTKIDLQVDHVDPKQKDHTITNMFSAPWELVVVELQKCQLLCYTHHLEKTRAEGSLGKNPMQGEKHPLAKLTEQDVRRVRFGNEGKSLSEWSRELGVSRGLISQIRSGKAWPHVGALV